MRETKNQKGITLIALIVTIIVLIIIAGISIATLTSDNGVIRGVNKAKVTQIEATAREQMDLACSAMRLAIAEASARDNSYKANKNAEKIQDVLLSTVKADSTELESASWIEGTLDSDAGTFTITYEGDDYKNACNDDTAKITYTITLTQRSIEVTDVATGIKDSDGNDISIDIGAGSDLTETVIVPEQTVTVEVDCIYGPNIYYCSHSNDLGTEVTEGETYVVVWDGVEYICTAKTLVWNNASTGTRKMTIKNALGSAANVTHVVNDAVVPAETATDEPFLLIINSNNITILTQETSGTHTIKVYQTN